MTGKSAPLPAAAYVLPHENFFWPGATGQVAHAAGVTDGLRLLVRDLTVIAAADGERYFDQLGDNVRFEAPPPGERSWYLRVRSALRQTVTQRGCTLVLIRSQPVFLLLLILTGMPAWLRRRGARCCIEINGLGFSFGRAGGGHPMVIWLSTIIYKLLLRPFDAVQVVNADLRDRLTTGFLPVKRDRVVVVHNGGPPTNFVDLPSTTRAVALGLFFFGLFNPYNDFALLIDAVTTCNARGVPVRVHFIGHGGEGEFLASRADGKSIFVHPPMSREEFAVAVAAAARPIGVLPMRFGNGSGSLSPLKAFDYMSLGIPLLYSSNCLQDVLVDGRHGRSYDEGNLDSLVESIIAFACTDDYQRYCRNIRALYPEHTWARRMESLVAALGLARPGGGAGAPAIT